jgi:hypothetical protein
MKKVGFYWILVLGLLWTITMTIPAWAAYSSHQNDQDINNFQTAYPFAKSTKLDDCSLCHPGSGTSGSCDYCHKTYKLQPPHGQVPLNLFGQAYKNPGGAIPGRTVDALRAIENADSDGDGKTNLEEIQALAFPGDPNDYPGLVSAPVIGLNLERILKLPDYSEFLLLNASKSQDFYARYRGVKIMDLLKLAGARKEATHITVFSPDGFSQKFPINAPTDPKDLPYNVMGPYPYGTYYGGLDFVDYAFIPNCLDDGDRIPDRLFMLLAYLRDGDPLTIGKLVPDPNKPGTLKLDGEGPYRLIPPQKIAGGPDRPSAASVNPDDGWNYKADADHNAGFSARTVAAIRVEPLPVGTTDFNWYEGGWNLVDKAKLVIYGAISPKTYWVWGKVADDHGGPVADVQISFGLISLGQVGGDVSSSKGTFKKDLPEGEYIAIPSKPGYAFEPESIKFHLSQTGYKMEFTAYPVN